MWVLTGPVGLYCVLKGLKKLVRFQNPLQEKTSAKLTVAWYIVSKHHKEHPRTHWNEHKRMLWWAHVCFCFISSCPGGVGEGTFRLQKEVSSHGFSTNEVRPCVNHLIFPKRWLDVCHGANLTRFQRYFLALKIPDSHKRMFYLIVTFHLAPNSVQMS